MKKNFILHPSPFILHPFLMKTILVIDDHPDVRLLTQEVLVAEGFRVETAENGVRGLSIAQRLKLGKRRAVPIQIHNAPKLISGKYRRPRGERAHCVDIHHRGRLAFD